MWYLQPLRTQTWVVEAFKHLCFWMGVFALLRVFFVAFSWAKFVQSGESAPHVAWSMTLAPIPLDLAMSCILIAPLWLMAWPWAVGYRQAWRIHRLGWMIVQVELALVVGICLLEAGVYPAWGSKLNFRILGLLAHPGEVLAVASLGEIIGGSALIAITWVALVVAAKALRLGGLGQSAQVPTRMGLWPAFSRAVVHLGLGLAIFVAARGGLKPTPINASVAHFSRIPLLNDAATNAPWQFLKSLSTHARFLGGHNPFATLTRDEAQRYLLDFRKRAVPDEIDPLPKTPWLAVKRPNIIFIFLESWSGDVVGHLGGYRHLTPNLDRIARDGITFTRFYANGSRTPQGLAAVLSGLPAMPSVTATDDTSVSARYPRFAERLHAAGYEDSLFLHGGQLVFSNLRAFLAYNGFRQLLDDADLPSHLARGRMGVHDEPALGELSQHVRALREPWIAGTLTVSSHSPFDVPESESPADGKGSDRSYRRSIRYADRALGRFYDTLRSDDSFARTLIVLVADHSHPTDRHWHGLDPEFRRIPWVLAGGAIARPWQGRAIDRLGHQVDIPTTLLSALDLSTDGLEWGQDLLADRMKHPGLVFYDHDQGGALVTEDGEVLLDVPSRTCRFAHSTPESRQPLCFLARAYVQQVMESFLGLGRT